MTKKLCYLKGTDVSVGYHCKIICILSVVDKLREHHEEIYG